jgi:putative PIN family toxin of toxin-antitoxin system
MKAVLDVGPMVSAVIVPPGHSGQILLAWEAGIFELVTSPAILSDVRRVLGYEHIRKRHRWNDARIAAFVQFIAANAIVTAGKHQVAVVKQDPTDNKILACAEEGQVDHIVASDEHHLLPIGSYAGIPIVRPRQFLEILVQHSDKP